MGPMAISAEQRRAYERARYAANPEKKKARAAARYEAHREELRAAARARYHADPISSNERVRAWEKKHPERAAASRRAANARRRQTIRDGDFTGQEWLDLLEEFDHACAYCQKRDCDLEVEHMTPLSRGGRHTKGNIVPACESCNDRKYTRTLFEFAALAA